MKIYEIVIQERKMSREQSHYVMAENFAEAITQAHKRLAQAKRDCEGAYIESISEQFKLEVIE